jgi:hypothetical protein
MRQERRTAERRTMNVPVPDERRQQPDRRLNNIYWVEIVQCDIASIATDAGRRSLSIARDSDGYFVTDDTGAEAVAYRFPSTASARKAIDSIWSLEKWSLRWK